VLALLKIVDTINNRIISNRLIPAIMEPIIVSQFLYNDGSFIYGVIRDTMSKNRKFPEYLNLLQNFMP
jgi:hypothetical protein